MRGLVETDVEHPHSWAPVGVDDVCQHDVGLTVDGVVGGGIGLHVQAVHGRGDRVVDDQLTVQRLFQQRHPVAQTVAVVTAQVHDVAGVHQGRQKVVRRR